IHGLDLAGLRDGTFKLTMPLRPVSKLAIPYQPKPIEVRVQENTVASVTVRIGRPEGSPRITEARLEFTRPVIISTPAPARKPRRVSDNATLNKAANWLADAVAHMHIDGLFVEGDGTVHM